MGKLITNPAKVEDLDSKCTANTQAIAKMMKNYGTYPSGTIEARIASMLASCYSDIDNGQSIVVTAFFTSVGTVTGTCSRLADIMQFNLSIGITSNIYYGWYQSSSNYSIYPSLKQGSTTVTLSETISVGAFTRTGVSAALTGVNHIYSVVPVSPASNWVFSCGVGDSGNKIRVSANGAATITVYYTYD